MNFKNHLLFSFFFIFFFIKLFNIFHYIDLWHIIFAGLITCLLPDIDHPKSFLNWNFFFIVYGNFFSHRKITHSLLFLIILFFILFYLNFIYFNFNLDIIIGMLLGYLSHIIADMFTYRGVLFFWPFNIKVRCPLWLFFHIRIVKYFLFILFIYYFFL